MISLAGIGANPQYLLGQNLMAASAPCRADAIQPGQVRRRRVGAACLLADPERKPLSITQNGKMLTVSLPTAAPGRYANVLCVELDR
jgi:hypothetical protein